MACFYFWSIEWSRKSEIGDLDSLSGISYSIDLGKMNLWGDLIEVFVKQFSYNTIIDVHLKDLKTIKSRSNERVFEYLA